MSAQPLLSVVMIVKNEAESIAATLASVRPFVDRYTILDTGSSDGTQSLIREALGDLPGEVLEEPFVDYATTRNRALALADGKAVFNLMLSGDEYLHAGAELRRFCEENRDSTGDAHGAYWVRMRWGSSVCFDLERITRSHSGWRYVGATHEYMAHERGLHASIRVPEAFIHHDLEHCDQDRKRTTWLRDLELLKEEIAREPTNARAVFYLAQTLEDLGRPAEAHSEYRRRAAMGGWREEVYEALFRSARTAAAMTRPWPDVQQLYLDAYAYSPHRAEPLHAIAKHWLDEEQYGLAFLFGQRARQLPFPEHDSLFVDHQVYRQHVHEVVGTSAYYVGEFDAGRAALQAALRALPGDAHLLANLQYYEERQARPSAPTVHSGEGVGQGLVLPRQIWAQMEPIDGWFLQGEAELLIAVASNVLRRGQPPGAVVEIGSYCGRSTIGLASVLKSVAPNQKVTAIDPHLGEVGATDVGTTRGESTLDRFRRNIANAGLDAWVHTVEKYAHQVEWKDPISLLLIDGLHDFDNVARDFRHFQEHVLPTGVVAFHDYSSGWPGVRRFVDELLANGAWKPIASADSLFVVGRTNPGR